MACHMVRFRIRVCVDQVKNGLHFIFERPQSARSWNLARLEILAARPDVFEVVIHLCALGARVPDSGDAVYRPTILRTQQ